MIYQNIGLDGNSRSISFWLVYIGLVDLFGLTGGNISPQTGSLSSYSSLPVALLSFPLIFLNSPLTLVSLSQLISIYTVMLNPADAACVTSISQLSIRLQSHDMERTHEEGRKKCWGEKTKMYLARIDSKHHHDTQITRETNSSSWRITKGRHIALQPLSSPGQEGLINVKDNQYNFDVFQLCS